jgi:hypothetical protein
VIAKARQDKDAVFLMGVQTLARFARVFHISGGLYFKGLRIRNVGPNIGIRQNERINQWLGQNVQDVQRFLFRVRLQYASHRLVWRPGL